MRRVMKDVIVCTNKDGTISIEQSSDDPGNYPDHVVTLTPEQVPILIDWLMSAKAELEEADPG